MYRWIDWIAGWTGSLHVGTCSCVLVVMLLAGELACFLSRLVVSAVALLPFSLLSLSRFRRCLFVVSAVAPVSFPPLSLRSLLRPRPDGPHYNV